MVFVKSGLEALKKRKKKNVLLSLLLGFFVLSWANPVAAFDGGKFCAAVKELSRKVNAEGPVEVDIATTQIGIAVICTLKTVEFKKMINALQDQMKVGWQDRKKLQWNEIYCKEGTPFREAINRGWNIVYSLRFNDGKVFKGVAVCN
jgi:hypothetical protein